MAGNSEDVVLSLGFDLSSIPKQIATVQGILKNQKLVANLAYQFGESQGRVRSQLKGFMSSLQKDIDSTPLNIPLEVDNLPRIRYALYDVSSVAQQASQALIGLGTASIKAASDFESSFTAVERTTLANLELLGSLRSQLEGIARDIPVAFADITEIASLGAQLGIASGDLAGFTETVAEFSAVTNVTTASAAQSFGALGELLNVSADEYRNLGSSIAQVGVNSVATESEILSVATQIGGVAASAGLSADYVIGLSGALASLRIPAEQSRGALTRVFQEINRAAAEGGPAIQGFANVLGVSTEEAQRLAQTDVQTFFSKFISGLSALDNTSLTTTLDSLNLSELRVTNTLTRLSRNTELLAKTQGDASQAYEDGTFLAAAYALKAEDLASKLVVLQNSFQELVATFGDSLLPIIGPIVDGISGIVQALSDAFSTDAGKWASGIAISASLVVGGLLAIVSTAALVTATLFALRTALDGLKWTVASGGAKGFAASLFAANVSAGNLTKTLFGTTGAIAGMSRGVAAASLALRAIPIVAVISALAALAISFAEAKNSAENAFNNIVGDTTGLSDALRKDTDAYNALDSAQAKAASGAVAVQYAGSSISSKYGEAAEKVGYTAEVLGKNIPDSAYAASSAIEYNTRVVGENTLAWLSNMLMQSEAFQNLAGSSEFANLVTKTGYDIEEAFKQQAKTGGEAAYDYYYAIAEAAVVAGDITLQEVANADLALATQIATSDAYIAKFRPNGFVQFIATAARDVLNALNTYWNFLGPIGDFLRDALKNIFNIDIRNAGKQVSKAIEGAVAQTSIMDLTAQDTSSSTDGLTDSFTGLGDAAGDAAKKIYLLTDYANDLSSIWERAFDIRWSGGQTLDKITSAFSKIAEETANARQQIDELNADIATLNADKALQEYFLSVAEAYGDTLKAQEIRANLAKIDADLTKKTKDLAKAQDKTNKTLVGNSDAAIENRSEILDLVKSYQDHVKALAASGMKQDELRAKSQQLKADFIAQATQLGYNVEELSVYAVAFDDVKAAIDAVPRDVTVDFNGDPALTAIEEFAAKAKAALNSVSNTKVSPQIDNTAARALALQGRIAYLKGQVESAVASKNYRMAQARDSDLATHVWALKTGNYAAVGFADGGYTGPGGKYDVAGIVHRGEYVVPKEQVNQMTGLPYFISQPRTFAQGGYTGNSGPTMVMLSPEDRALLRGVGGSGDIILYANNEAIARSANMGNKQIVAAGGRP